MSNATQLNGTFRRQAHIRRARHWIANRGWRGFAEEILWRVGLKLKGEPLPGHPGPERAPHPFDTAYNVDTAGLVWGESLITEKASSKDASYWATGYYGVAPSAFEAALSRLDLEWPRFTFIDIGCGKGRALLLSLRYAFRRIIGVELSPALAAVAELNLVLFNAPWRKREVPADIFTGDATTFQLPGGPLLLFLYHPFAAPVMERFLEHLARSLAIHPRPIYLLYTNPELAAMLDKVPFLERLWDMHFTLHDEDVAADRFGSRWERIIAYRTPPTKL